MTLPIWWSSAMKLPDLRSSELFLARLRERTETSLWEDTDRERDFMKMFRLVFFLDFLRSIDLDKGFSLRFWFLDFLGDFRGLLMVRVCLGLGLWDLGLLAFGFCLGSFLGVGDLGILWALDLRGVVFLEFLFFSLVLFLAGDFIFGALLFWFFGALLRDRFWKSCCCFLEEFRGYFFLGDFKNSLLAGGIASDTCFVFFLRFPPVWWVSFPRLLRRFCFDFWTISERKSTGCWEYILESWSLGRSWYTPVLARL